MVSQQLVLELMKTDLKRKWTAPELGDIIFKDLPWPRSYRTASVYNALAKLEKWGYVAKSDNVKNENNGHIMRGWVVI